MLAALANLRDRFPYPLHCIHIEHGIRPREESRGDAEFVRSLCKKFHVPCCVVSIKPGKIAAVAKDRGIGIEAAARLYRRRIWFREARRIEAAEGRPVRILTAHTADDMLETVLMRIFRGSGPSGLAAMPVSRGRLLRPLITLSRRDILDYLTKKNIHWREDSTNTDTQFLRNRIRHCLIPQLNEHFPQWRSAISSLAKTQSLTAEFIRQEAANRIKWSSPPNNYPLLTTHYSLFFAQPAIIREEALFQGINKLGLPAKIKRKNIRHFAEGKVAAIDLGPLQLRHDSHHIMILAIHSPLPTTHSENGFLLLIKTPGSYNLNKIAIKVSPCPADGTSNGFFALLPLVLRPCFKDDCIELDNGRKITPRDLRFPADITAEDSRGSAAFIGFNGLLRRGTAAPRVADGEEHRRVRVTIEDGGKNAKRSK
jgi:tRNA(Ile)-lysidine synthase